METPRPSGPAASHSRTIAVAPSPESDVKAAVRHHASAPSRARSADSTACRGSDGSPPATSASLKRTSTSDSSAARTTSRSISGAVSLPARESDSTSRTPVDLTIGDAEARQATT